MKYSWDWSVFFSNSVTGEGLYGDILLRGIGWTVALSLTSWVIALSLGTALGIARTSPNRLIRLASTVYVHCFRNTPLLVQLFLLYFVVPELLPRSWGDAIKQMNPALNQFMTVVACMTLYTCATVAEHIRSGILSVPAGQRLAGMAAGFGTLGVYQHILVPQAIRIVIPSLTSEFMNVFKNSAIALTIGLVDVTGASRQISEFSGQPFEAFIAATLVYMGITYIVVVAMRRVERKTRTVGMMGCRGLA